MELVTAFLLTKLRVAPEAWVLRELFKAVLALIPAIG
jgi:hypothetical protein